MSCCCPHSRSGGKIFSLFARNYRKRFAKKGFEPSQKQLVEGLEQAGFQNASVLEIGSGVGYLHHTLLERGAASATGIDLSNDMLVEASSWADEKGLSEQVTYLQGDFIELADDIPGAEVTVLDKVVCCYPFAEALVKLSQSKTKRVYALTYPRNLWFIRVAVSISAFILKLFGSDFRPYVHNPEEVEQWITEAGFQKQYQNHTFLWLTQVYTK